MNGARAEEFLAGLYAAGARDHAAAAESSRRAGSSGAAADASAVGACIEQVDRRAQLHRLAILWLVCRPAALALAPVLPGGQGARASTFSSTQGPVRGRPAPASVPRAGRLVRACAMVGGQRDLAVHGEDKGQAVPSGCVP